jgi:hypothetical protein
MILAAVKSTQLMHVAQDFRPVYDTIGCHVHTTDACGLGLKPVYDTVTC